VTIRARAKVPDWPEMSLVFVNGDRRARQSLRFRERRSRVDFALFSNYWIAPAELPWARQKLRAAEVIILRNMLRPLHL